LSDFCEQSSLHSTLNIYFLMKELRFIDCLTTFNDKLID
jgi:hypothetical protein